jgi:hypothetical protein
MEMPQKIARPGGVQPSCDQWYIIMFGCVLTAGPVLLIIFVYASPQAKDTYANVPFTVLGLGDTNYDKVLFKLVLPLDINTRTLRHSGFSF